MVRDPSGVLVIARAGQSLSGQSLLRPGDIIHAVNGTAVDGLERLRRNLDSIADGTPIVLQVERDGMLSYLALAGPAYPDAPPKASRFTGEPASPGRAVRPVAGGRTASTSAVPPPLSGW
jgi:membrane-associated protease RseP (regulator of RpoE activity)